jgi:L-seryl-tRNA(Ser) seleniumtransferase
MNAAAQHFVPITEMQERASALIARATGAEAGCIASGGAACLTLAAAACITGDDPAAIDLLPDTTSLKNEIVVHRAHRNAFDHAIRLSGARFVEFGYVGVASGVGAYRWQLEAAISEKTVAVFYPGAVTAFVLPLSDVAEIAHAKDVPVIVDAAGTMPPHTNLTRFISEGADLVAFSGGKLIRGPSASGFLAGRVDLVRAATLQQQDAYVHPDVWRPPFGEAPKVRQKEPPHQGLGRVLKVGREEIAGLMVALDEFVKRDHDAEQRGWRRICERVFVGLEPMAEKRVKVTMLEAPWVHVLIAFPDRAYAARTVRALEGGKPRVFVAANRISHAEISVVPQNVSETEVPILVSRLCGAVAESAALT